jgi:hypothetical protein
MKSNTIEAAAVIQEFHTTICSAKTRRRMPKTAPLRTVVARVRFLQLSSYDSYISSLVASYYSQKQLFERNDWLGKPAFVPRLDMCPGQEYSQYYCILKASIFRQQTSVDAAQNSSESAISFPKECNGRLYRKKVMLTTCLSPILQYI